MLQQLDNTVAAIEALFDGTCTDPSVQGVTIVWSGGLDNHPDIPPTLCDTVDVAVDLWKRELLRWADKKLAGHTIVWKVRPHITRWSMTFTSVAGLERFASERFCVYSVAAIIPTVPEVVPEPSPEET